MRDLATVDCRRTQGRALRNSSALLAVLFVASCGQARNEVGSQVPEPVVGVAVTVQHSDGGTVPGIFLGDTEEAAALTGGSMHFSEPNEKLRTIAGGASWEVESDSDGRGGLAVSVLLQDGSLVPGSFRGPMLLAEAISAALATDRGAAASPTSALILPEGHARVQSIEFGTLMRAVPSS